MTLALGPLLSTWSTWGPLQQVRAEQSLGSQTPAPSQAPQLASGDPSHGSEAPGQGLGKGQPACQGLGLWAGRACPRSPKAPDHPGLPGAIGQACRPAVYWVLMSPWMRLWRGLDGLRESTEASRGQHHSSLGQSQSQPWVGGQGSLRGEVTLLLHRTPVRVRVEKAVDRLKPEKGDVVVRAVGGVGWLQSSSRLSTHRVGSCCRLKPLATFTTLRGFSGPP